jgi:hypothetical protein
MHEPLPASLPVSLYWTAEWWDHHFHASRPRPSTRSWSSLETLYLRRQRFLFEELGAWGVGQELPEIGGQLATVIRHGFDLVPVLLGTELEFGDAWGFYPRFRSLDDVRELAPVDLASAPEGLWILREKERLERLYGASSQCLDLGSAVNNAFRVIGQDVYTESLARPTELRALLDVLLASMRMAYGFVSGLFGGMAPVPISNCNASLLGPQTYAEVFLPYDAAQCRFAAETGAGVPCGAVHHCDVKAESFAAAYARLPAVSSLQASYESDPRVLAAALPGTAFSAIVSPPALNGDIDVLRDRIRRVVAGGARDLAVWNVDALTSCDRLRAVCSLIAEAAREAGRAPRFQGMALCWEELEWAHGRYRPEGWSRDFE